MVTEREQWFWDDPSEALPPDVLALLGAGGACGMPDPDESDRAPTPAAANASALCTPRFLAPAPVRRRRRTVSSGGPDWGARRSPR